MEGDGRCVAKKELQNLNVYVYAAISSYGVCLLSRVEANGADGGGRKALDYYCERLVAVCG